MVVSESMFELTQVFRVHHHDVLEGQEAHVRRPRSPTTSVVVPTAGITTVSSSDSTAGIRVISESTHAQRPESRCPRNTSHPALPSLCAILGSSLNGIPEAPPTRSPTSPPPYPTRHQLSVAQTKLLAVFVCLIVPAVVLAADRVPVAILHSAAVISLAVSATIPPLRGSSNVPASWWIAMFATWSIGFAIFLVLELCRLPDWAQRRLLVGLFVFSGLNLTATLVGSEDSMREGWVSWGPLAMTTSLLLVPMLMKFSGVGAAVNVAGV